MEVKLIAVSDKRRRFSLPLIRSMDNALRFDAAASALPQEGEYEVYASLRGESKKKGRRVQAASQVLKYSKSAKHELSKDEVQEIEIKEEKKEKPSAVPYFLLVLVANAGLGGWLFTKFNRQKSGGGSTDVPKLDSIDHIQKAIEKLKAQAAVAELDFADPRLSDSSIVAAPADGGSVEDSAGEAPPPAEGAEAPAGAEAAAESSEASADGEASPTPEGAAEEAPPAEATEEPAPEAPAEGEPPKEG